MLLRASLLLALALGTLIGCGAKKGGKLMVDTPVLPYKAPDIEELSGVSDEPDPEPADESKPEAATPPPPQPVAATPAPAAQPTASKPPVSTPAKTPAKPPAAPATPAKKP